MIIAPVINCFKFLLKKDKYVKTTYVEYKEELLKKINKDKLNFNQSIIFLKNEKCELNAEKTKNNEMYKLLSVVSVIISCLSLAMSANPNKTYEVVFKSINQLQITTVGSIKIDLAELILLIFFILSIILFQNVSKYHLRLEVINDLIKEYEDKLLQEKKLFKTYLQSKYKLSDFEINQIIDDEDVCNQKYKDFQDYLDTNRKELKEKRLRINNDSST